MDDSCLSPLIRNLPLPPCMTVVGGSKKDRLRWKQQHDDAFLAAYKVCTKESHKWSKFMKRFMSFSYPKRLWDIKLATQSLDESCMPCDPHEDVLFSWEKKTDASKLYRPESLTLEEEELLNSLPLPPYLTAVGRGRKVRASVHQDILNLPVPLCAFQPPYHKRSAKKGLWWKQLDDDPFLTAYKLCIKEENKKRNFRKKASVPEGSLTREEGELLEEMPQNFPLPSCATEVGESNKINAGILEDIQRIQRDNPFLAGCARRRRKRSNLVKRFMYSFSCKRCA